MSDKKPENLVLPNNVPIIGQQLIPYSIAGAVLGFAQSPDEVIAAFGQQQQASGGRADPGFVLLWQRTAIALADHDAQLAELTERIGQLEAMVHDHRPPPEVKAGVVVSLSPRDMWIVNNLGVPIPAHGTILDPDKNDPIKVTIEKLLPLRALCRISPEIVVFVNYPELVEALEDSEVCTDGEVAS